MEQLDPNDTNNIDEKNFVGNIFANYNREELSYYLKYDLIPDDLLNELRMQPSQHGSQLNMRNTNVSFNVNLNLKFDKFFRRRIKKISCRMNYWSQ